MPDGSPIALPSRARVEAAIQALVDLLDEIDAPTEDMEDDPDRCEACDDAGGALMMEATGRPCEVRNTETGEVWRGVPV